MRLAVVLVFFPLEGLNTYLGVSHSTREAPLRTLRIQVPVGVILRLYLGYIGTMENKLETIGVLYRDYMGIEKYAAYDSEFDVEW